ncbi:hypothetical protein RHSIM_RhsimUnG0163500 [Rhododendron simsii]|uniref:Disease resistance protein At4g27190-like leucine-rich repeats domain-containing protein n=1 Tax=Rhododendron simsii TaxID=118357 RepID=A0A834L4G8_RHOSS|nr:hypothetical protein RHSIM_RhsimUnG0163500 [Rhododendron simsii]
MVGAIKIRIEACNQLLYVFPSHMLPQNLQHLWIENCDELEVIFSKDPKVEKEAINDDIIVFPRLERVILQRLPKLRSFYTETQGFFSHKVAFPVLEHLHFLNLDKITRIWDNQPLPELEKEAKSFSELKDIIVEDSSEQDVVNTVLVAAHGNSSQNQESTGHISSMIPSVSSVPVPLPQNQIGTNQSQFVPQHHYFPQNFRSSNNRGRGGRGSYYPKGPCDICGRSNHSTNYCYYRPNNVPFDVSSSQWRGNTNFSPSFPWNPMMPGVPQYTMPLHQGYPPPLSRFPAQNSGGYRFSGGFRSPNGPALPMQHSQSVSQMPSPQYLPHQPAFAGFTESFGMPSSFSGPTMAQKAWASKYSFVYFLNQTI